MRREWQVACCHSALGLVLSRHCKSSRQCVMYRSKYRTKDWPAFHKLPDTKQEIQIAIQEPRETGQLRSFLKKHTVNKVANFRLFWTNLLLDLYSQYRRLGKSATEQSNSWTSQINIFQTYKCSRKRQSLLSELKPKETKANPNQPTKKSKGENDSGVISRFI